MIIRKVEKNEYDKFIQLYADMIDEMSKLGMAVGWIMGVYPTYEYFKEQLAQGNCYVADDNGTFAGAMIVNTLYNEGYEQVSWGIDAKPGEFASLHLLGVLPRYFRQGIGTALTNKAIEISRSSGLKALRLDVIDGNVPANALYPKCGFNYVQDLELYYENCGLVNFTLYEYEL